MLLQNCWHHLPSSSVFQAIFCCFARTNNLKHYTLAQNGAIGREIMDAELAEACQIPHSQVSAAAGPAAKADQAAGAQARLAVHAGAAVGQQRPVARVLLGHSLGGACVAEEVIARPQVGTSSVHRQITLPSAAGPAPTLLFPHVPMLTPSCMCVRLGTPASSPRSEQSCTSARSWSVCCQV